MTSVYSKGDGVVRWQAQLVPYADCVEVTGSHVGLIFNRKSYRAIAQALAAPELPAHSDARVTLTVYARITDGAATSLGGKLASNGFGA